MSMPCAELVNQELRDHGKVVPDVPDHHQEMGAGYAEERGHIPVTLPPVPEG